MVLGTLWELFKFLMERQHKLGFGRTCGGHGEGVPKKCVFGVAGTSKSEPPSSQSVILIFCAVPEKDFILEWFWYLILELLGYLMVQKRVSRGA